MAENVTRAVVGLVLITTDPVENVFAGTVAVLVNSAIETTPPAMVAIATTPARPSSDRLRFIFTVGFILRTSTTKGPHGPQPRVSSSRDVVGVLDLDKGTTSEEDLP